jgi:hypothetical protein
MLKTMKIFPLPIGLGGSQIWSESLDEEKCLCTLQGIELQFVHRLIRSLMALVIEISRFVQVLM